MKRVTWWPSVAIALSPVIAMTLILICSPTRAEQRDEVGFMITLQTDDARIIRIVTKAIKDELWEQEAEQLGLSHGRYAIPDSDVLSLIDEYRKRK